jgi:putative hydrolase of the HAD superfamily
LSGGEISKHFKVESIVFDLFHTLVDPEDFRPRDFDRTKKVAEIFHLDPEAFSKYWKDTFPERCTKPRKTVDFIEDYVVKLTGKPCSKVDLGLADLNMGRYQDLAIKNPDTAIRQTLGSLEYYGYKLGLLANVEEREVAAWPYSPIAEHFDAVCFSCEIGAMKPAKEAYAMVLDRLKASAQNSIYIGSGELAGAKEAGFGLVFFMRGFVAHNGLRTREELKSLESTADYTLENFRLLPTLIEEIEGKKKASVS